jgi:anaerobic ribonucleoside-triphosphate reductase activating protein
VLKYVNTSIVFQEIPDEVTLAINISNCPCHCPGCHSPYLWQNIGDPLTPLVLDQLIGEYGGDITCICFMGGDAEPVYVNTLARYIHKGHPQYKVAWYSGDDEVDFYEYGWFFDYIKVGSYKKELGPLNKPTTNQRLYKIDRLYNQQQILVKDITNKFWKYGSN